MPTDLTPAIIGAGAVILAALISFIVAVSSAVIAKEQKVSEFRQAWINDFRNDMAIIITSSYSCSFYTQETISFKGSPMDEDHFVDQFNESFSRLEHHITLINLRLNPVKDIEFVTKANEVLNQIDNCHIYYKNKDNVVDSSPINSVKKLQAMSHSILKNEWERVKRGELLYRFVITTGKIFAIASLTAFILILISINFPHVFL